jgi:hypothetical protein
MGEAEYLDLNGCADLLGMSVRQLRRLMRGGQFPGPRGQDGEQYWCDDDVLRWAARHGGRLSAHVPLGYWPDAPTPARFLGATRTPHRHCHDDVTLAWAADVGTIAVVWRPDDPIMLTLSDLLRGDLLGEISPDVLVAVDPDFGLDGPTVRAINRVSPEKEYEPQWRDLARVLGQPMPHWPFALRDPDLIERWTPSSVTVQTPARSDLDSTPLLRMAAMFPAGHATQRTLLDLVTTAQDRRTRSASDDLSFLAEAIERFPDVPGPSTTIAAGPLVIGNLGHLDEDLDPTARRIGWLELLHRADTLSWQCVREIVDWDSGRYFPFAGLEDVEPGTAHGMEWVARLEPLDRQPAAFAIFDTKVTGQAFLDPATGAPAVRRADGTVRTVTAQRLPTSSALAELIIGRPMWVRTTDGTLYLAPRTPGGGLSWGYEGSGPVTLAQLIDRLLSDITTDPATLHGTPPEGLLQVTRLKWPAGTVLSRELLDAARTGRGWTHPHKPA